MVTYEDIIKSEKKNEEIGLRSISSSESIVRLEKVLNDYKNSGKNISLKLVLGYVGVSSATLKNNYGTKLDFSYKLKDGQITFFDRIKRKRKVERFDDDEIEASNALKDKTSIVGED